jgi:hypothetical protein
VNQLVIELLERGRWRESENPLEESSDEEVDCFDFDMFPSLMRAKLWREHGTKRISTSSLPIDGRYSCPALLFSSLSPSFFLLLFFEEALAKII